MKTISIKQTLIFFMSLVIILFCIGVFASMSLAPLMSEKALPFNTGWTYEQEGEKRFVRLPITIPAVADSPVTIVNTIPDTYFEGQTLLLCSGMQSVLVTCGEDVLYHYPKSDAAKCSIISPGSMWLLVGIPAKYNGMKIAITVDSKFKNYPASFSSFFWGSKTSLFVQIIKANWLNLFIASFILCVAIGLMAVYLLSSNRVHFRSMFYLALTLVAVSFWLMGESKMLQFFTDNEFVIARSAFVFLGIIPVPMVLFFDSAYKKHHFNFSLPFLGVFIYSSLVSFALHVFGRLDFSDALKVTSPLLVFFIAYVLCSMLYEIIVHKNTEAKNLFCMTLLLLFVVLVEIVNIHLGCLSCLGFILQLLLVVYIVIMAGMILRKVKLYSKKNQEAQYYQQLAYTDALTYGKNRAAYIEDLKTLLDTEVLKTASNLWLLVFDLNGLKLINDIFGHVKGDEAIKNMYASICEAFCVGDAVYRMGGDEFACILYDSSKAQVIEGCDSLKQISAHINSITDYSFSIAVGYGHYDYNKWPAFESFFQYVYEEMRKNKQLADDTISQ